MHNLEKNIQTTGWEPVLGGQLAEKAVWVDEANVLAVNTVYTSLQTLLGLMNFMEEVEL